ncbi:hypothetical protein V1291_001268 [Nitrobacteraceae bacterium AZCC 1564]
MPTPSEAVATYILAKDNNRPFLMRQAFAEDASLEMLVKTDTISFPSSAKGLSEIEDVLIRRFGIDYENVYTVCLSRPNEANVRHFPCHWLVGMSAKADGKVRVGCGRYDWFFSAAQKGLVEKLVITIDVMECLPEATLAPTMNWLAKLPYPWSTPEETVNDIPRIGGFERIEAFVKHSRPIAPDR